MSGFSGIKYLRGLPRGFLTTPLVGVAGTERAMCAGRGVGAGVEGAVAAAIDWAAVLLIAVHPPFVCLPEVAGSNVPKGEDAQLF